MYSLFSLKSFHEEEADPYECPVYNKKGWLEASVYGRINELSVNSENTSGFKCVYFSMPLMATSTL
jgi:hypothetical protein